MADIVTGGAPGDSLEAIAWLAAHDDAFDQALRQHLWRHPELPVKMVKVVRARAANPNVSEATRREARAVLAQYGFDDASPSKETLVLTDADQDEIADRLARESQARVNDGARRHLWPSETRSLTRRHAASSERMTADALLGHERVDARDEELDNQAPSGARKKAAPR